MRFLEPERAKTRPPATRPAQRAPVPGSAPPAGPLWHHLAMRAPAGRGERMPPTVQAKMERSFGFDFSPVRIHQDDRARSIGARAYAQGTDLHFAPGEYAPHTPAGQAVLGHELAHVTQQASGRVRSPQALGGAINDDPALESEADEMGRRAASGEPAGDAGAGDSLESRLRSLVGGQPEERPIQRLVEVPSGSTLPGFDRFLTRNGNVYSYPQAVDRTKTLSLEIFGSLFNSPRVFRLRGKDGAEAETSLLRHIRAREGVVEFAGKKKYAFEGGRAGFTMNPKYWTWDKERGKFGVREDADEQAARDDLNVNPQLYAIGCAAATMITVEGGGGSKRISGSTSDERDWVPGESGFIRNAGWNGTAAGLEGENIIYMGLKQFWGHFKNEKTIQPYQKWVDLVNGWNENTAVLDTSRDWPGTGLKR